MMIKIALYLELFRYVQSLSNRTKVLYAVPHLNFIVPPWLVSALDQNRHAACRLQVHLLSSQFAALGETLLRTLTKAWKYAGMGE